MTKFLCVILLLGNMASYCQNVSDEHWSNHIEHVDGKTKNVAVVRSNSTNSNTQLHIMKSEGEYFITFHEDLLLNLISSKTYTAHIIVFKGNESWSYEFQMEKIKDMLFTKIIPYSSDRDFVSNLKSGDFLRLEIDNYSYKFTLNDSAAALKKIGL